MPVIPQLPQRWSKSSAAAALFKNDNLHTTKSAYSDDNTDYADYYQQLNEANLASLKLHPKPRKNEQGKPSVIGTIPANNRIQGIDDSKEDDVFRKFKMDEKYVGTAGLVINQYEDKIISMLESNQVLIVEGFTGCGKTTQVPQFILNHASKTKRHTRIVVTQPRRIAAISVANRVCEERGWTLGSLVGYQVGMDCKLTDDTRISYMTTGVLLKLLINKKRLTDYTHIIIDEVHERDLDTDLLLLVIKQIIIDRRDSNTKIILMSATLDTEKFFKYYPVFGAGDRQKGTSVVSVDQPSAFAVKELYLDQLAIRHGFEGLEVDGTKEPKVHAECYELACSIINGLDYHEYEEDCKLRKTPPSVMTEAEKGTFTMSEFYTKIDCNAPSRGAVLVFLPGYVEIDTMYKQLHELSAVKAGNCNKPDVTKWIIYPLYSSITAEEQCRVFKTAPSRFRKIILTTNIAESSITIPDIKYVIDFCLTKSLSCDPVTNFSCLRLEWASKNQCIQRRGRCGRVAPGICYRLISYPFYRDLMPQEALPEMERASLETVILNVKQLEMGCPLEVLSYAIDPPKQSGIGRAVSNLKEVGALTLNANGKYDAYDGDMTYMGSVMALLPIDFRLGRLIVLGHVLGCLDDAIIIAAGLHTKSPFSHPYTKKLESWLSKFDWSNGTYSDCLSLMSAFHDWSANHRDGKFRGDHEERNWSRTYFLQLTVLRNIGRTVEEIKKRLENVGIISDSRTLPTLERGFILKLLIAGAFYPNYFLRPRPVAKEYQRDIVRDVAGYSPFNSVTLLGFPIDQPGKLYAKHIADKMTHTNCIPQINFKSSKVIVTFDPRGDKHGSISSGVYRAIKIRMLRDLVVFRTLPREDSKRAVDKAASNAADQYIQETPKFGGLPSMKENQFMCMICHIKTESPNEFYVTRKSDEACLAQVNEILNGDACGYASQLKVLSPSDRQPGAVCIIMKKKRYIRGRIEALASDQALVYGIDVGITTWRNFQFLFKVTDEMVNRGLLKIPALAIHCRLSELRPSCRHGHDWVQPAFADFSDFVEKSGNNFEFTVYSVVDGVVIGELYNPKLDDTINNLFLRKTYLEKTSECQDSKENAQYRQLCHSLRYDEEMIDSIDKKQNCSWEPTRYVFPPKLNAETGNEVSLRGPTSPLEMHFTSLCRSAHMKAVQVEGSSVNCVALDTDPFNPSSRVMIAASVGIAHRSGNILARETTIMPPVPGLLSLLTMLFAPKIEFRLDPDQTRYTGCVSGLGTDPLETNSVYPDHDMEVIFDVNIDNEDLDRINSIRTMCNTILRQYSGKHQNLESLQEKIRSELTLLLQREREPIEETWPHLSHVWNRLPYNAELYNPPVEYSDMVNDVFSLHVGVCLKSLGD
ncbi:ATP-dependent RNA helicase TDRD9 [Folsomia candida]|uniref:ATP-dependent RNA helicase TDRD9 n=1 Tax=Folsomia candida TaxID=158441 RepID=UPI000B8F5975|nr:ATP-dependent RNA helicase TDRD9 [Folsomia candida]